MAAIFSKFVGPIQQHTTNGVDTNPNWPFGTVSAEATSQSVVTLIIEDIPDNWYENWMSVQVFVSTNPNYVPAAPGDNSFGQYGTDLQDLDNGRNAEGTLFYPITGLPANTVFYIWVRARSVNQT